MPGGRPKKYKTIDDAREGHNAAKRRFYARYVIFCYLVYVIIDLKTFIL